MDRNFFIELTFASHRVADALPDEAEAIGQSIKKSANRALVDLLMISEKNSVSIDQKCMIASRVLRELDYLYGSLTQARDGEWLNTRNFQTLQVEYAKVREFVADFVRENEASNHVYEAPVEEEQPKPNPIIHDIEQEPKEKKVVQQAPKAPNLTPRQERIMQLLQQKDSLQVREVQSVMPNVTKRTLRRDFDDLLKKGMLERTGEWNSVSYRLPAK